MRLKSIPGQQKHSELHKYICEMDRNERVAYFCTPETGIVEAAGAMSFILVYTCTLPPFCWCRCFAASSH